MTDVEDTPRVSRRGFKLRLDPNAAQRALLTQQAGAARVAFNMMCAHNHEVLQAQDARKQQLKATGKTGQEAWEIIKEEKKNNSTLQLIGYKKFSTDHLTPEIQRHRVAAQLIDNGEDPATVWANERYDTPWLHTVPRRVLLSGLQQCGSAFSNWLQSKSGKRKGKPLGKPRFKSKRNRHDSFTVPAPEAMGPKGFATYKRGEARSGDITDYRHVRLSHLGTFRTFDSTQRLVRALCAGGVIKSYTVSRTADRWYVSFLVQQPLPETAPTPTKRQRETGAVGIDLGVSRQATLSTGEGVTNPRLLNKAEKKIKRVQRRLTKTQKGSNNETRLKARQAKLHHVVALQRAGFLQELTSRLTQDFAAIGIEDLNVAGMTSSARGTVENPGTHVKQKAGLNRAILDTSPAEFRRLLEYKCLTRGVAIVAVDRFFPSSQTCSQCKSITKIALEQRIYDCPMCGLVIDRDVNAAINIAGEAARVAMAERKPSSAPEGAEDKWPWSLRSPAPGTPTGEERRYRAGKTHVVTAVEQSTAHPTLIQIE